MATLPLLAWLTTVSREVEEDEDEDADVWSRLSLALVSLTLPASSREVVEPHGLDTFRLSRQDSVEATAVSWRPVRGARTLRRCLMRSASSWLRLTDTERPVDRPRNFCQPGAPIRLVQFEKIGLEKLQDMIPLTKHHEGHISE